MLEQAMLSEQFQSLLSGEQQAMRMYAELAARLDDPGVRNQIQELLRDKERHIRLAQRLLEIVE